MASSETERILSDGRGYRCHGEFDKPIPVADLVEFECHEMGNRHVLVDTCETLGLPVSMIALRSKHGGDKAVWLGLREGVKEHYCHGEEPDMFKVPSCARVLCDLGPDGALFLYPQGCSWV